MKYLLSFLAVFALSVCGALADTAAITASTTPVFGPGQGISNGQYDLLTYVPAQDATFSSNNTGAVSGKRCVLKVTSSGTTSYTLTFSSTYFASAGTLSTGITSGTVFLVEFQYDGTLWRELKRSSGGGTSAAGGFSVTARGIHTGGHSAQLAADGNNSTPVITETYVSEIVVPYNCTVTGIAVFNGSDVTGNMTVQLATSTGAPITSTKSASTAGSGTDAYQLIPFGTAYNAVGPATYYIQVQYSSATARYNTHAVGTHGVLVQTGGTYGTFVSFTPPTTFVTNVGNIAGLY